MVLAGLHMRGGGGWGLQVEQRKPWLLRQRPRSLVHRHDGPPLRYPGRDGRRSLSRWPRAHRGPYL